MFRNALRQHTEGEGDGYAARRQPQPDHEDDPLRDVVGMRTHFSFQCGKGERLPWRESEREPPLAEPDLVGGGLGVSGATDSRRTHG